MRSLIIAALLALSACGPEKYITVEKPVITYVEKPVRCPSKEEYNKLMQNMPEKLAYGPVPPTLDERVAQMAAQLGRYEAPGAFLDQIQAVLDRCQAEQ